MPDAASVRRWAEMLPERPRGVGPTIDDRQAWQSLAGSVLARSTVKDAEKLLSRPTPKVTDELYLVFSRTGNRSQCEAVQSRQISRFNQLVLAECLENRGRFLDAIDEIAQEICHDKSWTHPSYDRDLAIFHGTTQSIDLRVASLSWNLATAIYWLGDRLRPETKKLMQSELQRRTFQPMTDWLATGKPAMWWVTGKNNWNAVCLAGVTGAALACVESRQQRAKFAAAAEQYIQYYLDGFTPDGYCSEGLGYWNYGFGNYLMLAETLRQASGGRVDLMLRPSVVKIAEYVRKLEILPGVYPAFADCGFDSRPDVQLTAFVSRRMRWGLEDVESQALGPKGRLPSLFRGGVFCFPNSATATPPVQAEHRPPRPHDWFPDAQVLICRPNPTDSAPNPIGAAMKGGHNGEQHNHNDVGSYMVVVGKSKPLVDPGNEIYTRRTFSSHRYESNVLNSFGHAVPIVAGRLQKTGKKAAARVVRVDLDDASDVLVLDLSAAYSVPSLQKLTRTFQYSRGDQPGLMVQDLVQFEQPQAFGTALITFDAWKQLDANHLRIGEGKGAVTVEISVEGGPFKIKAEEIHEQLPKDRVPTRIGIDMAKPVSQATITVRIRPAT